MGLSIRENREEGIIRENINIIMKGAKKKSTSGKRYLTAGGEKRGGGGR